MRGHEQIPVSEPNLDADFDVVRIAREAHEQVKAKLHELNRQVERFVKFYEEGDRALEGFLDDGTEVEFGNGREYGTEFFGDYVETIADSYQVPQELILAIMCKESMFDPSAVNGGMVGFGQFTSDAWADFQKSLPEGSYALGKKQKDGKASIEAIAWRCRAIADRFGLDPRSEEDVIRIYEAYRLGNAGFIRLQNWRESGVETHIPRGSEGLFYGRYGMTINTYADFANVSEKMGYDVCVLTQRFGKILRERQDYANTASME